MSKKFGKVWIDYLRAAWQANEGCLTEEEFRAVNGGIPEKFMAKLR